MKTASARTRIPPLASLWGLTGAAHRWPGRTFGLLAAGILWTAAASWLPAAGDVGVRVTDATTQEPIAARMTVLSSRGAPVRPRQTFFYQQHFVFDGTVMIRLPDGKNSFQLERGLEYRTMRGHFEVEKNDEDGHDVALTRFANLREEGWWSGDLDVQRPVEQMPTHLLAEDLYFATVATPWPQQASLAPPAPSSAAPSDTTSQPAADTSQPAADTSQPGAGDTLDAPASSDKTAAQSSPGTAGKSGSPPAQPRLSARAAAARAAAARAAAARAAARAAAGPTEQVPGGNAATAAAQSAETATEPPGEDGAEPLQSASADLPTLATANAAPTSTAWDAQPTRVGNERAFDLRTVCFADQDNVLLLCRLPAEWPPAAEPPQVLDLARRAREAGAHICLGTPASQDLPILAALGLIDSVAVMNRHTTDIPRKSSPGKSPTIGRAPDSRLFPPPRGAGRWSEQLYFKLINAGLRVPCVAGSGSGVSPLAVGQNRFYVWAGKDQVIDYDGWWEKLAAGQTVITNGPLLRPLANGQPPGHVFQVAPGGSLDLQLALTLSTRTRIDYLEIIQNGEIVHHIRLEEFARKSGKLPRVKFDESGWLTVRAVANNDTTYEYALSAPFYVEVGDQPRVSRAAAEFMLAWAEQRRSAAAGTSATSNAAAYAQAVKFWEDRVAAANAP